VDKFGVNWNARSRSVAIRNEDRLIFTTIILEWRGTLFRIGNKVESFESIPVSRLL
jgi:hypothetical protein